MSKHCVRVEEIRLEYEDESPDYDPDWFSFVQELLEAYDYERANADKAFRDRDINVQRQQKWRSRFQIAAGKLRRVVAKTGHQICLCKLGDNVGCGLHNKKGIE